MASQIPHPRLTMVITELDVGGAEKAFVKIAIGLKQMGWQVNAVSLRDAGLLTAELTSAGIPVEALNCGGFLDFRAIFRLRSHLKKSLPTVLLSFLHQANIAGRLAACGLSIPLVVSGVRVADIRPSVKWPERWTRCCVHKFIANSSHAAETHSRLCGIPVADFCAIPNGVDIQGIQQIQPIDRAEIGIDRGDVLFAFIGRLTTQKSPLAFLEAFLRMTREIPSCSAVLVGDGPMKQELNQFVEHHQLKSRVRMVGFRSDAIAILRAADALILPSVWEGMPNVVMEAMAAGVPVIASGVDGNRELLAGGLAKQTFAPNDPTALVELMKATVEAKLAGDATVQELQLSVIKEFTWDRCVSAYDRILRQWLAPLDVYPD